MRRATQPDAVLAAADGGGYMLGARQYERKRPRPECLYQRTPFGGNRGSPIADIGFRRHKKDDGMIGWAALGLINGRNGLRVPGVCEIGRASCMNRVLQAV